MSDCFVLYLLLTCMKKKTSGADKFTNNTIPSIIYFAQQMLSEPEEFLNRHIKFYNKNDTILTIVPFEVFKEVFF